MNKTVFFFVILAIPFYSLAQELSPTVISSAGEVYTNGNVSLSWTLGEVATQTLSNGNVTLTQGFQQPFELVLHGIDLDVLVYLEGPFNGTDMNTTLKNKGLIPLSQPFNANPWFYAGSESVPSIPANVVDWVLVEIRDAESAATAIPGTIAETQAAFLLNNGAVVGLDGSSSLLFTADIYNDPYVVVWHRNHLGVLSASEVVKSGAVYTYNFSSGNTQAYGSNAQKAISGGIYGMYAGDASGGGNITDYDNLTFWKPQAGTNGYLEADYDMDGEVANQDKNDNWQTNFGQSSQVPE